MFNSSEPRREGYKDGWRALPPDCGFYGDLEWAAYMAGYDAGRVDSQQLTDGDHL